MTETISRGPQFKGFVSLIGLIIFAFSLVTGIVSLVHSYYLSGTIFLIISAVFFFLFLDIRGIEFNYVNKLVRTYKQFLWIRYGDWIPLEKYNAIHLVKDNFYVRTAGVLPMAAPGLEIKTHSRVSSFDVTLVATLGENNILMSEFDKHADAVSFMKKYSEKLSLPSRDIYRELQASAVSRRGIMR